MSDQQSLRILHVAVSMNPSLGVIKQMESEQQAANELGLPWTSILHTASPINSQIIHQWTNLPNSLYLRYFWLRKKFYDWLMDVEKNYDLIILRHSVHDYLEASMANRLGHKLMTMHHTLEVDELRSHGAIGPIRALAEKWIGSEVIRRSLGIVAVTPEILNYEHSRNATSVFKPQFIYPNGINQLDRNFHDLRSNTPEILFVASYFSPWHGLDLLLDSIGKSKVDFRVHVVGAMSKIDLNRCQQDPRVVVHGVLNGDEIESLMSRSWCGISSLALERKGMEEACSLKVREYLNAGIPIYANHRDSGLPSDFLYFKQGEVDIESIIKFSYEMRSISRETIASASNIHISKTHLLNKFYSNLNQQLLPLLKGVVPSDRLNKSSFNHQGSRGLIALTGGSGFIGSLLLPKLLSDDWRVRLLTRSPEKFEQSDSVEVFNGDLLTNDDWSTFMQGVNVVIHAAAEIKNPELMMAVNVDGPQKMLAAALDAGVSRWVQLSSVGAYGPVATGWITENSPENPQGVYEKSKTIFDQLLRKISLHSKLEICIVRPSNVYGPNMTNQSLFQMIRMIMRHWFFYIGSAGSSANYVHVNDVVDGILLCAKSPKAANNTYILSDWTTLENMVHGISDAISVSRPSIRLPLKLTLFFAHLLQWLPKWPLTVSRVRAMSVRSRYSTEAIERDLGWHVKVPVISGIHELSLVNNKNLTLNKQESPEKKEKILIISYDWPPRNSIATHRPYSWAKYWAEQGFDVTVLTAAKKFFDFPLDLNLPKIDGVKVIEADYRSLLPTPNPTDVQDVSSTFLLKKIKRVISFIFGLEYDVRTRWAGVADEMIEKLGTDFNFVVSTFGPDSAHKIASKFKNANPNIFWVADYRDLWSLNARTKNSRLMKFFTRRKELQIVDSADMFVTISKELAELQAELVKEKLEVIFNGFDVDLYVNLYSKPLKILNNCLNIVYTGRIYPTKRSPMPLLRAIEKLIDTDQVKKSNISINFYGINTTVIQGEIDDFKYPEIIKHHGYIQRSMALQLQQSADLLLLLESGDADSKGFLTGKIFEYIGAGRPIMSIGSGSDSAISRVLNETNCGVCYGEDESLIMADLLTCLRGKMPSWFKPNIIAIQRYSRKHQAEQMIEKMLQHRKEKVN